MALYGMQGSLNNLATILSHSITGQREPVAVASEMVSEVDKELPMNVRLFLLKKFKEDVALVTIYASTTDPSLCQQFVMDTYNEGTGGTTEGASGSGMTAGPSSSTTCIPTNEIDFNDIYK